LDHLGLLVQTEILVTQDQLDPLGLMAFEVVLEQLVLLELVEPLDRQGPQVLLEHPVKMEPQGQMVLRDLLDQVVNQVLQVHRDQTVRLVHRE